LFGVDERGIELTFGGLRDAALRVAAGMTERGVGQGSVVSWQLPSWLEAATLTLALARLGAVQNPLIPILRHREVSFICDQAGTDLAVVPGTWRGFDYATLAADVAAKVDMEVLVAPRSLPDADPAGLPPAPGPDGSVVRWYFYTSGTTADPKGAQHSDETLIAATKGFVTSLGLTGDDRLSLVIPVTHVGGIIHILATLLTGCALVFAELFDPERTPVQLRNQGATLLPGGLPFVQAFFAFQDRHPELDPLFPKGRVMIHGGSPKPPRLHFETKERLGTAGIVSGYGMTECPMAVWNRPGDDDQDLARTEGVPVPGVDLVTVTQNGKRAEPGEEGEVRVRGPQLMKGYVDAALDAEAFDEQGFFRSGDLGVLDTRSRLTITGRLKDVIIRNMENISASELENLLYTHPKVAEAAVIGLPNPRTGEHACAVVVARDRDAPPSLRELCDHLVASGLSDRKLPEQLEIVEQLPRNAMEKVLKADLRKRFNPSQPTSAASPAPEVL
jgi:acyl-CoA synthetase (AMP-forming)/AMP-acid ligase II